MRELRWSDSGLWSKTVLSPSSAQSEGAAGRSYTPLMIGTSEVDPTPSTSEPASLKEGGQYFFFLRRMYMTISLSYMLTEKPTKVLQNKNHKVHILLPGSSRCHKYYLSSHRSILQWYIWINMALKWELNPWPPPPPQNIPFSFMPSTEHDKRFTTNKKNVWGNHWGQSVPVY